MQPLFSIITVTYNAEDVLPATLKSIKEQTCHLYELIIIDGKSSDATVKIVQDANINNTEIVSEKDRGIYDAMNKGLGLAQGDYVIFLNAGDSFHSKETLEHLADAIMDNDYPGIVYGQTDIVDKDRNRLGDRHLLAPEVLTLDSFKDGMLVCHQAFCVLRKITNNYDTRIRYSADYEWCIRCLQRSHRNYYLNETVIDFLHGGTTTQHHVASLIERFNIMSHYYGLLPTLFIHMKKVVSHIGKKIGMR